MQLTLTSYAQTPVTLTVADGTSTPPYALISNQIQWGNAIFDHQYSGPRGTQGRRPSAGLVQNRSVTLPVRVYGTSKDSLATNIKNLASVIDSLRQYQGRISWQSANQSFRQHLEVQGVDGINVQSWDNRAENRNIVNVEIILQCAPYALGDPMDVDDTSFATLTDYTFDENTSSNVTATTGALKATSGGATSQSRMIQTQRGYTLGDAEITVTGTYAQAANYTLGTIFWRTDANNYWVAYLQDSGTAATLKVDQVTGGVTTNRAVSTPTRPAAAATVYVRVRCESTSITAEYWSALPTPMGTPATTATHTAATAGTGQTGLIFQPRSTTPQVSRLQIRPFTYSSRVQPSKVTLRGTVPGDINALGKVELTTKQALAWAAIAWQSTTAATTLTSSPTPRAAFTVFNGNDDVSASRLGWTTADATLNTISTTTASSATTFKAVYSLDPSLLPTDAYADGDRAIEVWCLTRTDSSTKLVTPTIVVSLAPASGPGPTRYSDENGSAGVVSPTLAAAATVPGYRWTRLGTVHMQSNAAREMYLTLTGSLAASTTGTGTWGIARVVLCPVRQRAVLPTTKVSDSTYPAWSNSTTETVKSVDSDLMTTVFQPSVNVTAVSDRSLGGTLIEIPPGNIDMLTILSALVPDDPTASTSIEYVATGSPSATTVAQAAVHFGITPRFAQLRS